jgi:hypothetical protein
MERSEVGIRLTHEVMASFLLLMHQIWSQLELCKSIRVQPYAL